MVPIPGLGISRQMGNVKVKRMTTKINIGYGLDGVMFIVNKNLPESLDDEEDEEEETQPRVGNEDKDPAKRQEKEAANMMGTISSMWSKAKQAKSMADDLGLAPDLGVED